MPQLPDYHNLAVPCFRSHEDFSRDKIEAAIDIGINASNRSLTRHQSTTPRTRSSLEESRYERNRPFHGRITQSF